MTSASPTRRSGRHAQPLSVPPLTAPSRPKRITTAERVLDSGLRVVVVRRPSVPMVEVRLRIPFLSAKSHHLSRSVLLSDTMLTGTSRYDRTELAIALQELGGDISVGLDADRLLLSASALATKLPELLGLFAEVLTQATYPKGELVGERDRLLERLLVARSQAGVIANEALGNRLAPGHPYGTGLPSPEDVGGVTAAQVRKLHADLVRPEGAVLVIVGDVTPARALDSVERQLADWTGKQAVRRVPAVPDVLRGPLQILHRPDSVQTALRFGGHALGRTDPRYPALQLANLAFGGLFSSRWVENIREAKGYTYSPRSSLDHSVLASAFTASADVATEVTAPAVVETLYELGRIATLPITEAELDLVRQYAIGTLALSLSTQAGLASTLSGLLGAGIDLDWLNNHPVRLAAVTRDEIAAVSAQFLAPSALVAVAVGDSDQILEPLRRVLDVELVPTS
ncbi:insulinase family protein [Jatrophihabitans telluris]|uniref:Insulinase family protein n=1 Tax=Jatrophihabitans telluris TaxID=2038343 RepID=A0ABY4R435_9ACTN|nr:pitrilysin family protein [Jatrophihabitans telluris]UQX89724.1 insulinase family protein [Jatrophihabitans telluris]